MGRVSQRRGFVSVVKSGDEGVADNDDGPFVIAVFVLLAVSSPLRWRSWCSCPSPGASSSPAASRMPAGPRPRAHCKSHQRTPPVLRKVLPQRLTAQSPRHPCPSRRRLSPRRLLTGDRRPSLGEATRAKRSSSAPRGKPDMRVKEIRGKYLLTTITNSDNKKKVIFSS
jgi:hypothetical protein